MDLIIRPMTSQERMYSYSQSMLMQQRLPKSMPTRLQKLGQKQQK